MKSVLIKKYNQNDVITNNKILFNVNNAWIYENREKPHDYEEIIKQTHTCNWINKFHTLYHKITLDEFDLRWMKEAFKIGSITNKFSHLFDDDLEFMCKKYNNLIPKGEWFIRTDSVSLKHGIYGIGPYDNFEKIIKSMVTTINNHRCFEINDNICDIYFLPWKNIDFNKEFRIFVFNNEITCISTQHLYDINEWLKNMNDDEIIKLVNNINNYFNENIKEK